MKIDTHSIIDDHWQKYYKPGTCKLNLEPDYKSRRMMVFSVKFLRKGQAPNKSVTS